MINEELDEKELRSDRYYGVGSFVLEIIKIIILAVIIIFPIRVFLFQPFFVQGDSMRPNFEDSQYLIVNQFGYKETRIPKLFDDSTLFTIKPFKSVDRQSVVVFRYPLDQNKFFIKRVIGLPGEKIEIKNGKVTIYNDTNPNGFVLDESSYLADTVRTDGDLALNLKEDEYFMIGDNRRQSSDSRVWGPVKSKFVMGEVLLRAWPINKLGVF